MLALSLAVANLASFKSGSLYCVGPCLQKPRCLREQDRLQTLISCRKGGRGGGGGALRFPLAFHLEIIYRDKLKYHIVIPKFIPDY